MFTGIIQGVATIQSLTDQPGLRSLALAFPPGFANGLQIGASVSVDGVCLTVARLHESNSADFDVILQSQSLTTLGTIRVGEQVNVERAAAQGAEVGGHPLSGHIDFSAALTAIRRPQNNSVLRFSVPAPWMRYLFAKGYVALNGASLTLAEAHRESDGSGWFEVWLIPETLRMTTFGQKQVGAEVNVEIDRQTQILVDTIRDALRDPLLTLRPIVESLWHERNFEFDALTHSMKRADAASIGHRSLQRSARALYNGGLGKMATKKKAKSGKAKKKAKSVKVKKKAKPVKAKAKSVKVKVKKKTKPVRLKAMDEPPDDGGQSGQGVGPHAMTPHDEPPDDGGQSGQGVGPHAMTPHDEPPDDGGQSGQGVGPHAVTPRKKK
jgi:riboflavin synthase